MRFRNNHICFSFQVFFDRKRTFYSHQTRSVIHPKCVCGWSYAAQVDLRRKGRSKRQEGKWRERTQPKLITDCGLVRQYVILHIWSCLWALLIRTLCRVECGITKLIKVKYSFFFSPTQSIRTRPCFKKAWCRSFAITSSAVNRFWKFFHCWKQQWIICKINMIFFAAS